MRNLEKRVEALEARVRPPVDASHLELDDEGCIAGFRVSYRFGESGAVVGLRFGDQMYNQRSYRTIMAMRGQAFFDWAKSQAQTLTELWREFMRQTCGHSRGLPCGGTEEERAEKKQDFEAWEARDAALRARVEMDAKRRPGEHEWGDRVIPIMVILRDR